MLKRKVPTVDAIMSSFRDTVTRLQEVSEVKQQEASFERGAADEARLRANEAEKEAERARSVAANLNKLMGDDAA